MEFWICAVAKCEELYIREWVEWHKKIGFTHIIIGDNNKPTYPYKLYDYIKEYVDSGFVEIIDESRATQIQPTFYNKCYRKYIDKFDYITFIDIDEFIELPKFNNNIYEYVTNDKYKNYDAIVFNCIAYNDNELLYYEDKPVRERFTTIVKEKMNSCKFMMKKNVNIAHIRTSHFPIFRFNKSIEYNICDGLGNSLNYLLDKKPWMIVQLNKNDEHIKNAYISHYVTRSTEEYIKYKTFRGEASFCPGLTKVRKYNMYYYFRFNKKTQEKMDLFDKYKIQIEQAL